MLLRCALLALSLTLAACGSTKRPEALVPVAETAAGASVRPIFVATSRRYDAGSSQFSDGRSQTLGYQTLRVSIPPVHKAGEIEWPAAGGRGDQARHFVTLENSVTDQAGFIRSVEAQLPPSGEVMVFVHGYNTNHEEAIFRLAQIAHDTNARAAAVAFTWPSRGAITDYVTDRESSMAARNRLYELLAQLSRSPKVRGIHLLSHSMGGMLAVETLTQAKLRGNGEFGGKLDHVVLASPDIDVDVFLAQFEIIGRRPKPTVILVSRDDQALRVSRRIAGDVVRVGASSVRDPKTQQAIQTFGFTVVDLTDVRTGDASNHTKFARSPAFLQAVGAQMNANRGSPVGALIADTAGAILETPANLMRSVAR